MSTRNARWSISCPLASRAPSCSKIGAATPIQVLQALNDYNRADGSSNAELNLLAATNALGERPGTRAVMLMTDAESNGYDRTIELWHALEQVRPRVFTFEISTAGEAHSQDLMQDWAEANHGEYGFMSTIGEFENGFAAGLVCSAPSRVLSVERGLELCSHPNADSNADSDP